MRELDYETWLHEQELRTDPEAEAHWQSLRDKAEARRAHERDPFESRRRIMEGID